MPNDEILAAITELKETTQAILAELERQQTRNYTNGDFLIAEFKALTKAVNHLAEAINAPAK